MTPSSAWTSSTRSRRKSGRAPRKRCYFAFPFAAEQPAFEYQIQNGWCPNEDQMPGACREWFTPQNSSTCAMAAFDVAWATPDAPLVCLTDINRGQWPAHLPIKNGHVYSYDAQLLVLLPRRAGRHVQVPLLPLRAAAALNREALARFDADTRAPVVSVRVELLPPQSPRPAARCPPRPAPSSTLNAANLQMVVLKRKPRTMASSSAFREIAIARAKPNSNCHAAVEESPTSATAWKSTSASSPRPRPPCECPTSRISTRTVRLKAEGALDRWRRSEGSGRWFHGSARPVPVHSTTTSSTDRPRRFSPVLDAVRVDADHFPKALRWRRSGCRRNRRMKNAASSAWTSNQTIAYRAWTNSRT